MTALRLYDHWKMMIYCSRYSLLTPRNGRRKFHSPVQIPSMVLQCTSRTPSPSSSRVLPGEFRGRHLLRDAPEDQEDLAGAEVCTLPGGAGKHVEDPAKAFAAVVDDRRLGAMAMDVQPVPGAQRGQAKPPGWRRSRSLW